MTDFHGVSNIEQTAKIPHVKLIEHQVSGATLIVLIEPFEPLEDALWI